MLPQFQQTITRVGVSPGTVILNDWFFALMENQAPDTNYITLPRRGMIRQGGVNTVQVVDTGGVQAAAGASFFNHLWRGASLFIDYNGQVWYVDHNGFVFKNRGYGWEAEMRIPSGHNQLTRQGFIFHQSIVNRAYILDHHGRLYGYWPNADGTSREWIEMRKMPQGVADSNWQGGEGVGRLPNGLRYFITATTQDKLQGYLEYADTASGGPGPVGQTTWNAYTAPIGKGRAIRGVAFVNNTQGLFYGTYGALGITTDGGLTWNASTYFQGVGTHFRISEVIGNKILLIGTTDAGPMTMRLINFPTAGGVPDTFTYLGIVPDGDASPVSIRVISATEWYLVVTRPTADPKIWNTFIYHTTNEGGLWARVHANEAANEQIYDLIKLSDVPVVPPTQARIALYVQTDSSTSHSVNAQYFLRKDGSNVPADGNVVVSSRYRIDGGSWITRANVTIISGAYDTVSPIQNIAKTTSTQLLEVQVTAVTGNAVATTDIFTYTVPAKPAVVYSSAGYLSPGHFDSASACAYGPGDIEVFTSTGFLDLNQTVYYDSAGTQTLSNGYYTDGFEWYQIGSGSVIIGQGQCGTFDPGDGGGFEPV